MQDVVARDFRGAVARDQRERIERDRRAADIGDVVLDREEIAVVDRDGAAEGEAFTVVVFQRHRVARRQRAGTLLLPHRIAVGQPRRRARGSNPAKLRIIGMRRARRREQHDRGRIGIDSVAELRQRQVVDACALERDAAGNPRRLDLDAGRAGDRGVAADDGLRCARLASRRGGGRGRTWRRGGGARRGGARRRLRRRLGEFGLGLGLCALPLHLRHVVEILPGDQHEAGQNDGEDGVAIVGHRFGVSPFNSDVSSAGRGDGAQSEDLRAWSRNRG